MIFPIFLHYYLFWPQTEPPRDALDTLTLSQADLASLNTIEQTDFLPFDPITKRTEGTLRDTVTGVSSLLLSTLSWFLFVYLRCLFHVVNSQRSKINKIIFILNRITGEKYRTTKGAPHIIMELTRNEGVKRRCEADVTSLGLRGIRALAVAKTDDNGNSIVV